MVGGRSIAGGKKGGAGPGPRLKLWSGPGPGKELWLGPILGSKV